MSEDRLQSARRIVVKIGSALVADADKPRQSWLDALASDIANLRGHGKEIVLVSSGSIALGRGFLGQDRPRKLSEKQAAAALGQPLLMAAIGQAFAPHNIHIAQSLLTLEDTENRRRWLNARATITTLLDAGALPIINENDTVATDEIRYGDNDRLAARVAQMIGADVLILLSDIDGLYTADPRLDLSAEHIGEVRALTPEIFAMGGDANERASVGSGGMATKLAAAQIAWTAGCATVITLGDRAQPIGEFCSGGKATWFIPDLTPDKAREAWLRGHLAPEGAVVIDVGAEAALANGSSLLPIGVTGVEGQFDRGAAIEIKSLSGAVIAKGITAYSSDAVGEICGLHTEAVEEKLGYRGRPAIIHRDDLIMIGEL